MYGWIVVGAIGLFVLLAIIAIVQYNRMVTLRNRVRESWSNVDTELMRRADLVPNLVAAVKGYVKHEKSILEAVTTLRARAATKQQPLQRSKAERELVGAMDRLLAVAEAHPRLQASKNFLKLQDELAITEDRIQAARRFYNGNVRGYHDQIRQFPGNMFAPLFGMRELPYFHVEALHMRAPVGVSFTRS